MQAWALRDVEHRAGADQGAVAEALDQLAMISTAPGTVMVSSRLVMSAATSASAMASASSAEGVRMIGIRPPSRMRASTCALSVRLALNGTPGRRRPS